MHEVIVNIHMHTLFSDGHATHTQIARAAAQAGIDAIIVTDHNVFVHGVQGYYEFEGRKVLLLVGEEIHDQARTPQKNHLLVFGAEKELAQYAADTQKLIQQARGADGLAFIAHPYDPESKAVNEGDISWVDWGVMGYHGLELWNGFSEFKSRLKTKLHAIYFAYQPERIAIQPAPEALHKWDELLKSGLKVVVIGGSDAHALPASLGPLKKTVFPYEYHFKCINTHVLLDQPLSGVFEEDRKALLEAIGKGRSYIAYDLPAQARGFNFTANGLNQTACMGDEISVRSGVTFQISLPIETECHLIKDGAEIKSWQNRKNCTYITSEAGVYRVEAYIPFLGRKRGWIFSNPIYAR